MSTNHIQAECRHAGEGYAITLHGTRPNATHSLLYYLVSPMQDRSVVLVVPRLSGTVGGEEVNAPADQKRRFVGAIHFSEPEFEVTLHYPGGNPPVPNEWNGRYRLEPCSR